jgi:hypothetical protein
VQELEEQAFLQHMHLLQRTTAEFRNATTIKECKTLSADRWRDAVKLASTVPYVVGQHDHQC